ncbi:MAG: acyl-CoA dehydrogenase family protein [Planctomycetes bacterium]|nr:acyl-CoA dehydrogenase family protein [Planctomycetota bacterium]
MEPYLGVDYMEFDTLLTEEERMIRDTTREFVSNRVIPIIEDHYRDATFPNELIPEMAELGFLGANLDGYGCAGLGPVAYGLIMQELERGDSGLRSFVSVQGALCMYPIHAYGSEAQKEKWLPGMAAGTKIGCFGLTEPDFGSHAAGMITRAEDKGDHWLLNGAKMWITNGCVSDVAIVWAKVNGKVKGFLVEKGTPGFTTRRQGRKMSLRASVTSELILQDVKIPKENLLPGTDTIDMKGPLSCLTQARYGIAWGGIGAGMACYDAARQYGLSRIQFGKPLASFQLYQKKLAEMITEITKGQLLNLQLGRLKELGKAHPSHVSMAKRNGCEVGLTIAREARDMLGANGITDEYVVMRHMCNMESVKTYEGTHDIHTLIIGLRVTGISAFE